MDWVDTKSTGNKGKQTNQTSKSKTARYYQQNEKANLYNGNRNHIVDKGLKSSEEKNS